MSEARAVKTNGEGKRTTAHLNLTRSLADVWGIKQKWQPNPSQKYRLKDTAGLYLHESGQGTVPDTEHAWCGTYRQLDKIRRALPLSRKFSAEAAAS